MKNESHLPYSVEEEVPHGDVRGADEISYASDGELDQAHHLGGRRRVRSLSWDATAGEFPSSGESGSSQRVSYGEDGLHSEDLHQLHQRLHKPQRANTTGHGLLDVPSVENGFPRTMTLSRGSRLPKLTILGDSSLRRRMVVDATHQTFRRQIIGAAIAVSVNMIFFGALFAYFEGWNFFEGLYFTYIALLTIGMNLFALFTFHLERNYSNLYFW
jgi:hypothetical protein